MINVYSALGDATSDTSSPEAMASVLAGLSAQVVSSRTAAVGAYNTLKSVRETLDLPFIVAPGGEGSDPNGWSPDLEQQAVDIIAMATVCKTAADDAVAGKRRVVWDDKLQDWGIEGFPSDLVRLQLGPNNVPVLVDQSGNATHVSGQVGIPQLLIGGAVVLTLVQALVVYLLVSQALKTLQVLAQQKTERTLAEAMKAHADLVAQGKATPEQAMKLDEAAGKAQTDLAHEHAEQNKEPSSEIPGMVKTLAWVALGVGILYVVGRTLPAFGGQSAVFSRANPVRFKTIADVKQCNRTWFEPGAMRFFRTRVESALIAGRYFITSEKYSDDAPRLYSIREVDAECEIETVGKFQGYGSREAAKKEVDRLLGRAA